MVTSLALLGLVGNLLINPDCESVDGYELKGQVKHVLAGYTDEITTQGFAFSAYDPKGNAEGSISQLVTGIDQGQGKWLKFSFRGRPEDGFIVKGDQLYMKFEFFAGKKVRDSALRLIYREVENDRKLLTVNGNYGKAGAAVWRTYEFEELMPFPDVDSVRVTVGFAKGAAKSPNYVGFCLDDFSLTQSASSSRGLKEPSKHNPTPSTQSTDGMTALGGRWFYRAKPGESTRPLTVTYANADRLFYKEATLTTPFNGTMTSWLRPGHLDISGNLVKKDVFVPDNVVLVFDGSPWMTVRAKNIPNHPTARFPDTYGTQGYNPAYIQEHNYRYRIPLDPQPSKQAYAMTPNNSNGALNMGAIGFAVNGVVFYNPFDAGMQDASSIMDRCCGHPSPDNRYHYHKYPICVNTPFVDKGESHSQIIGFAFDGFPVYGPYEREGVMAKDDTSNPLNSFNAHFDAERGWHYHVTPGKFPYLIGGYWGSVR